MKTVDTTKRSDQVLGLIEKFKNRIVAQERATEAITNTLEKYLGGLVDPKRPIGSLLFLGPTGTGKTSVVEALCEGLYHDPDHMIKIDCAEFQHSHEIAKLIGSPPGYLGHRETPARLASEFVTGLQTEDVPFTVILFDEIEKASDEVWHLLLGILDRGEITLGNNTKTDFRKTIIIMTSNVGARQMSNLTDDEGLGFRPLEPASTDRKVEDAALSAAKTKFTPEFLNRLDEIVVFNTLTQEQIYEVMGMEIAKIRVRFIQKNRTVIDLSPAALKELFTRGYDKKYNARAIRRTLEKEVLTPVARAMSSGEVNRNDHVVMDYLDGVFKFYVMKDKVFVDTDSGH
jgi:ATP-dependent Clp protease ATP-binding subunit ClpA